MPGRKLPPIDTLLADRAAGLTDSEIADRYGVHQTAVSTQMRAAGHGRGPSGGDGPKRRLPAAPELLQLVQREGRNAVAARYGVKPESVTSALAVARRRNEIAAPNGGPPNRGTDPVITRTKKPTPTVAPQLAKPIANYVEPDLTGLCGARELLGTRVCDKHPHPRTVAHEGHGPLDPRGEFWAVR